MQMELHEKEEDVQHIEHITKRYVPIDDGGANRQAETIRQRTVFSCYHQGKGCGRMTAKAESPPVNGNEMKVSRRTLRIWPNGASVLGCAFITDERDINGILMIPNRHQDVRNRRFLVPSAGIVLRTGLLGFLLDLTFDRVQFFVGLRRLAYGRRCFHQPVNMTVA